MSIHGIGRRRFERIVNSCKSGMVSPHDKRGRHDNHNKVDDKTKQQIRDHIQSFPKRMSHYSRTDNPNRHYLSERLNIRRMWVLYLSKYEPDELLKLRRKEKLSSSAKYWLYNNIFNTEFNLSFGSPRTDTCSTCDRLHNDIKHAEAHNQVEETVELKKKLEFHHRKAEVGYKTLKEYGAQAKNGEIDMLTFDFMQNLPVPTLSNSEIFYSRQLWVYLFGVHNMADDSATMTIWSEATAKRGSSEVCTALHTYIQKHEPKCKRLVLVSDGCGGQNKNRVMFAFLLKLVKEGVYERIDHIFLTRGHTFLPNDRDFGIIEKYKRGRVAYVPHDYVEIIENARVSQQFEVVELQSADFLDYMTVSKSALKTGMLKDTDANKPQQIRELMWFSYGKSEVIDIETGDRSIVSHSNEIWARRTLNDIETWLVFSPLKRNVDISSLVVTQKYDDEGVVIKSAKYNDLIVNIVNKGMLQEEHAAFYRALRHDSMTVDNDDDGGDDYVYA